jgi:hypothetical protein
MRNERKSNLPERESVAATNRWWKETPEGLEQNLIKDDMDAVKQMMGSLKTFSYINETDRRYTPR